MNAFGEEYHLRMLAVSQSIGVLSIFKCSQRCCVLKKKVKWRNISLKKATEIEKFVSLQAKGLIQIVVQFRVEKKIVHVSHAPNF